MMNESRLFLRCAERDVYWVHGVEPARCTDAGHEHQQHEVHRHRDVVVLPDDTPLTAVSFDLIDPYVRHRLPDYGLYLDRRWQPPWPHGLYDWPDFGVPDPTPTVAALQSVLDRARSGQQVEIGCLGGHGRTGTALACLAILAGEKPGDAVAWVRANYCSDAVETNAQEEWVTALGGEAN